LNDPRGRRNGSRPARKKIDSAESAGSNLSSAEELDLSAVPNSAATTTCSGRDNE
jgi:hypothetical protein